MIVLFNGHALVTYYWIVKDDRSDTNAPAVRLPPRYIYYLVGITDDALRGLWNTGLAIVMSVVVQDIHREYIRIIYYIDLDYRYPMVANGTLQSRITV